MRSGLQWIRRRADAQAPAPASSSRDSVRRRLWRPLAVILGLLVFLGAAGVVAVLVSTAQVTALAKVYAPAAEANAAALQGMLNAETSIRGYTLTHDPSFLAPYRAAVGTVLPEIDAVRTALAGGGDHHSDGAIATERSLAAQWLSTVAAPIAVSPDPSTSIEVQRVGKALFDRFREANAAVSTTVLAKRADLRNRSLRLRNLFVPAIIGVTVAATGVAIAIGTRTARRLAGPVTGLWSIVRRLDSGDLSARADPAEGPAEVRAVAAALNTYAGRAQVQAEAEARAEDLRVRSRPISARVRRLADPVAMAQSVITELGTVFDVDRVGLTTFDDERVPTLTLQWHRPGLEAVAPMDEVQLARVHAVAGSLWESAGISVVPDYESGQVEPAVLAAARHVQARSSILTAVGDGASAFGVLWMVMTGEPREWTVTEVGLVQRLASDLAAGLMHGHIIVRQREAVERMRELDAVKSAFVSTVSHELRTPLTSISGYLEMVLDGDGGPVPEEAADMLRIVERNAVRLRALIEDLLTQSRIEAGRLRVSVTRTPLGGLLSSVAKTVAPLADAGEVSFVLAPDESGSLAVDADPRQLEQALTNLVANAIKFTPAGGSVTLSAAAEPTAAGAPGAAVRIVDTGIGIPAAELPRLYDRFFRASNAAKAAIPGTGLGLSIVREIVNAHQGELEVESEVGVGSTFVIRLPLAGSAPASPEPALDQPSGAREAGR